MDHTLPPKKTSKQGIGEKTSEKRPPGNPSAHHRPPQSNPFFIQEARRVVEPTFPNHHDICWPVKHPNHHEGKPATFRLGRIWKHDLMILKCHAQKRVDNDILKGNKEGCIY